MKKIAVYCICALMFLILSFADFMGLAPFGIGLIVALTALGLNAPVLSAFLILSGLFEFSWISFAYNVCAGIITSLWWLINLKYKLKGYWYIVCAVLAQVGLIIAAIVINYNLVATGVSVFLSLIYAYIAYSIGVPIIKNRLRYKFLDSELICGGIVIASLTYGLAEIPLVFPLAPLFFACVVLFGAKAANSGSLAVGLCCALGYAISDGVSLIGAFALMSVTALIFIPAPRILSALSLIMSFIMYTFFFNLIPENAWMWIVSLLLGGLIYILIPQRKLKAVSEFFSPDGRKALRSMVNRSRVETGRKLEAIGGVFGEMSVILKSGEDEINQNHLAELSQSLIGSVCAQCTKYESCVSQGMMPLVCKVMQSSLEKGRVSVADLPDNIKSECISLAGLISTSSQYAEKFSDRLNQLKSVNAAKKTVSAQLNGIAEILFTLAKKEAEPLRFDAEIEKKIAEELTYRNVITMEALVTGNGTSVMLNVLTETVDREVIKIVLKKMLKMPFVVDNIEDGNISGYTIVYASAKPRYDVVFSACGCPKNNGEPSGDTHSFIKIGPQKFMMAVCDGMGSGKKANEFSTSTISLIENFYKAGFSHSLVLGSVNNFLSLSSEDIYSAVDIAVVDLCSGMCDIIKIGSPTSYIKTKDSVFKVDGSALPIGVLEEMKPSIMSYALKGGETIVLTSDGAADSFNGDKLADIINNSSKLPEELCKAVVDAAISETGSPIDDITVASFHIFEAV